MSLTAGINVPERSGDFVNLPVATGVHIFPGALVAINSTGYAVPAANTAGLRVIGRAEQDIDNSLGADGDVSIVVKKGVFRYANSATNAITAAMLGKVAFVEDDATVGNTGTNKVKAGRILDLDADGVWIDTRVANDAPAADSLTALTFTAGGATGAEVGALRNAVLALLQGANLVK